MSTIAFDDLLDQLSSNEHRRVRRLLESNEIELDDLDPQWTHATVFDGRAMNVRYQTEGDICRYRCTCDQFLRAPEPPCAHVIAVLNTAELAGRIDSEGLMLTPAVEAKAVVEPTPEPSYWKKFVARAQSMTEPEVDHSAYWPADRQLMYMIDVERSAEGGGLVVQTIARDRKRDGTLGKPQTAGISRRITDALTDPLDRNIASILIGANAGGFYYDGFTSSHQHLLSSTLATALLPMMCQTGRCVFPETDVDGVLHPLTWDANGPWRLQLWVESDAPVTALPDAEAPATPTGDYTLTGTLIRGDERMALSEPLMLSKTGFVFTQQQVAPLDDSGAFEWIELLRGTPRLQVPREDVPELIKTLNRSRRLPQLKLPPELQMEEVVARARPRLRLKAPKRSVLSTDDRLRGELSFDYAGTVVAANEFSRGVFQPEQNRVVIRDQGDEAAAAERLRQLGFKFEADEDSPELQPRLSPKLLPKAVKALLNEDWHVEADGKLYRRAGAFKVEVSSGIDWFDLNGKVDFGGQFVSLPTLLAAMRRGESVVPLGDGTFGLLPEEWLAKYAPLAAVATAEDDALRFNKTQVGLLDALLALQPESTVDETFRKTRDELLHFQGVVAGDAPEGFVGELRHYQRETLGWFEFLRKFGFGGCLADDMGLGKTVQVLALLETRRTDPARKGPALVVVPRSLVFNWQQEATKFAPGLRVLDHSGINRAKDTSSFAEHDLVLTTYGTLRRDAAQLKDVHFDYIVLDEAQAIKNPSSESAKAARLLTAAHRLVLSGTPVQNHLGDLWSLFEFLNPGMLGAVSAFSAATLAGGGTDEEGRALLARGLRPFILRRTKEQVAPELPARMEQTLYCELETEQRKLYDELREHYRHSLLGLVDREGIGKARIQILEALLRLRQAACHPGLIDKTRDDDASAKLDTLVPRLLEVTEDGHKALIFSQFTQFLAIVRKKLDKAGLVYEYLDGRTRDRQQRVDHFQTDPNCKLFLISLKAGGLGLNLTAADYVFLLDPWWNPAVEAQAIDRSHRIGQTRQVFACRLIARDTVEEKVLALQQSKRSLADAIINGDNSLLRSIDRQDLQLLLS